MKIAVCLKVIQPRDGTSHFALQLGRVLAGAGHDVTMVAEIIGPPEPGLGGPGLPVLRIGQTRWETAAGNVHRIGRLVRERGFRALFICSGLPVRHLEQALCLMPDSVAIVPVLGGDREHVYQPVQRTAAAWNFVVAESPRLLREIRARVPEKPARLLTTGIVHPEEGELAGRAPLSVPLRLLYVGRLFGRKNVWMLPKILAACLRRGLPSTLSVCGYGPDRGVLEQACREEGVADRVEFLELPSREDLYGALRSHHVSLLTSSPGEGLGLVLLEAQANGCVPVASRLPGVTDFSVEDGVTGLLAEVGEPESFAEQVGRLADPEVWRRFSEAGVARTRRQFSLEEMARQYGGLLEELEGGCHPLPVPRSRLPRPRFGPGSFVPRTFYPFAERLHRLARGARRPAVGTGPTSGRP